MKLVKWFTIWIKPIFNHEPIIGAQKPLIKGYNFYVKTYYIVHL